MKNWTFETLLFLVLVVLTLACQNESRIDGYLKKLDKGSIYNNDYKNWILQQEFSNGEFRVYKQEGDTLKSLNFWLGDNQVPIISEYEKVFPGQLQDTCFLVMQSGDTSFFYTESSGVKNFVVGGYMYRYSSTGFDEDEYDFYYLYEDSLKRVRGNDLPKLPLLTKSERDKLKIKMTKKQ